MITEEEYDRIQVILGKKGKPRPRTHIFAFTGLMRCGECGATITAEDKVKHQKNGKVHQYVYYHCTKRLNRNCSQKCVRKEELEKQILMMLERIEIPQGFHQWALDELKNDSKKDSENIKKITEDRQKEYNDCLKKFDAIVDMRANGELTQDEFLQRKESLLQEREKIKEIMADSDKRVDEWLGKAEKYFNFAKDARANFQNGTLAQKREILYFLGSNLLLKDKILSISIQKPLILIEKMANEVREIHSRLEPVIIYQNEFNFDLEYARSATMLRD